MNYNNNNKQKEIKGLEEFIQFIAKKIHLKFQFYINPEKKITILKVLNNTYKITCHEEDTFDPLIGVGLAISRTINKRNKLAKYLKEAMDYKQYATFCINYFFDFDKEKISKFIEEVKNFQTGKAIEVEI